MPGVKKAKFEGRQKKKEKIDRYYFTKFSEGVRDVGETVRRELDSRVESFNKAVNDEPNNIESWLTLVDFQVNIFLFSFKIFILITYLLFFSNLKLLAMCCQPQ